MFIGDSEATVPSPAVESVDAPTQLYVGISYAFKVRVEPAGASQEVTWSVEEGDERATFSGNVLTARRVGIITVRATSVSAPKSSRIVKIRVSPSVPLTGVSVSPVTTRLSADIMLHLVVVYTPTNATNKSVTWSSSDEGIATVDTHGVVTGKQVGTATITATAADGGHTARCEVRVVADDRPSGAESAQLAGVSVSPNPFEGMLTVRGAEGVARYALVSAAGTVVLQGAHDGGEVLTISTPHLPLGIYWLRLSAEDGARTVQVVSQ